MISELSILIPVYNDNALPLVSELQRQAAVISGLEYEILDVITYYLRFTDKYFF